MPKLIDALFGKPEPLVPIPTGLYSYHTLPEAEIQYRLHLRVEPDGEGLLIVNASSVLHLNQTATEIAWHLMQGHDPDTTGAEIAKRYSVEAAEVTRDAREFLENLQAFINKTDQEPVSSFGFEPHYNIENLSAPYRLDCGLTYRYEPGQTDTELDTDAWKNMIRKAYQAGVPHFVFFGGDPTLRADLLELLKYIEGLGLVSGLVTNSPKLNDENYVAALIAAGLDHLMVPLDPDQPRMTLAVKQILAQDLYTCVHLDIDDAHDFAPLLQEFQDSGINAFSFHPVSDEMVARANEFADYIEQGTVNLVDDLPLPYEHPSRRLVSEMQEHYQGDEAYVLLQVDPTGKVMTRSGEMLGDLLNEDFAAIWARRSTAA